MKKYGIFLVLLAIAALFTQTRFSIERPPVRPNIVWIMAEDINLHLGCFGEKLVHTPNIDRLAANGIRCTNAYTVSGVCAPSRASIITGMYSTAIGTQHMRQAKSLTPYEGVPFYNAVPPAHIKAFPEYLRQNGYFCTNNRKTDYQFGEPFTVWDSHSNKAGWRDRSEKNQPFFSCYTFESTHEINVWPDSTKWRFFKEFGVDTMRLVNDVKHRPKIEEKYIVNPSDLVLPPYYPDAPMVRADIARHYTNISRMDTQVGAILKQLDEDGLSDNTIIVFMGDNGDGLPRAKRWLYDSGIHVPLIVYIPEKLKPRIKGYTKGIDNQMISFIDLAPTMLSLSGIPIPKHLHGRPFLTTSTNTLPKRRTYIHAGRDRMDNRYDLQRAVRDSRYKYIRNYMPDVPYTQQLDFMYQMPMMQEILTYEKAGKLTPIQSYWLFKKKPKEELYDTQTDPHEIKNLADSPQYTLVLNRMREELARWQGSVGDYLEMPEVVQAEKMWPQGKQPKTPAPKAVLNTQKKWVLNSNIDGVSIGYRWEGESFWRLYVKPFAAAGKPLEVKAVRYGWAESEVVKIH